MEGKGDTGWLIKSVISGEEREGGVDEKVFVGKSEG
jgi:hypothetical protein